MDYSLLASFVHGILQARILEWVAMPFSRGSSQPRGLTQVSHIAGRLFIAEPLGKPKLKPMECNKFLYKEEVYRTWEVTGKASFSPVVVLSQWLLGCFGLTALPLWAAVPCWPPQKDTQTLVFQRFLSKLAGDPGWVLERKQEDNLSQSPIFK